MSELKDPRERPYISLYIDESPDDLLPETRVAIREAMRKLLDELKTERKSAAPALEAAG